MVIRGGCQTGMGAGRHGGSRVSGKAHTVAGSWRPAAVLFMLPMQHCTRCRTGMPLHWPHRARQCNALLAKICIQPSSQLDPAGPKVHAWWHVRGHMPYIHTMAHFTRVWQVATVHRCRESLDRGRGTLCSAAVWH